MNAQDVGDAMIGDAIVNAFEHTFTARTRRFDSAWYLMDAQQMATLKRIDSFAELRPNWDSYRARQIVPSARQHARRFLLLATATIQARGLAFVQPFAAPLADGGVQLEWEEGDICIELEFASDGALTFLRETRDHFAEGTTTTEDALGLVVWFHQKVGAQ